MPCYRCGTRQTDPVRGPSAWKRGVRGGTQVLICPICQCTHDWQDDLDHCAACGSTMLVRILGEAHCRACGATGEPAAPPGPAEAGSLPAAPVPVPAKPDPKSTGLAGDVEAALDRLFGRARA
jgi:hypothetical protein